MIQNERRKNCWKSRQVSVGNISKIKKTEVSQSLWRQKHKFPWQTQWNLALFCHSETFCRSPILTQYDENFSTQIDLKNILSASGKLFSGFISNLQMNNSTFKKNFISERTHDPLAMEMKNYQNATIVWYYFPFFFSAQFRSVTQTANKLIRNEWK